jgi:hypothetical protein
MSATPTQPLSHRRRRLRDNTEQILSNEDLVDLISSPVFNAQSTTLTNGLISALFMIHRLQSASISAMHPHDLRRLAYSRMTALHANINHEYMYNACPSSWDEILPPYIPSTTLVAKVWSFPRRFYEMTRLSPSEFAHVYLKLSSAIMSSRRSVRSDGDLTSANTFTRVHPADQLLVWLLISDGASPAVLAFFFGDLDRRTIERYWEHVTYAINRTFESELYWPSAEERAQTHGLFACCPTAIAVMDGTHCQIRVPTRDQTKFYSGYKKYHSQNYLLAVDAFDYVLYASDPFPGRSNDRGAFNTTEFVRDDCTLVSPGECIIVDGGFPGRGPLLQPYTKPQMDAAESDERRRQMAIQNENLTLDRVLVEHCIHTLKSRAQSLIGRFPGARERQALLFRSAVLFQNRIHCLRISKQCGIDVSAF